MLINGQCHCGNVTFDLDWPGDAQEIPARACGCSFCVKHGGVWTSNPDARLHATVRTAPLTTYAFGTRTAVFHVCSRCGVVPFATSDIAERVYAVVSVNTLENVEPARLRRSPTSFDGETLDARLARRARNWIADVRIDETLLARR